MNDDMKMFEFDIRGQICPSTLLTALRQVNRHRDALRSGCARLHFFTDNRDATTTIPDAIRNMGYVVTVTKERGWYRILVCKDAAKDLVSEGS